MSFYEIIEKYRDLDFAAVLARVSEGDVRRAMAKDVLEPEDLLALLSPAASKLMEDMARRAQELTLRNFGRTVQLFTPLYLANFCTNRCVYCGFNTGNKIDRRQMDLDEVRREGRAIAATGLRQLLVLTGDAPAKSSVDYIVSCLEVLREFFPSLSMEVYAMTTEEYARCVAAGADSVTMFQETYNETLYPKLHPAGPKSDYRFRLDAPERVLEAGMRGVGISALYGLDDWRRDAFFTAMHARWLQERFPAAEVGFSLPRMRPHEGDWQPEHPPSDRDFVQILLAQRLFQPRSGITVSTREAPGFREHLLPLGVTRMSAGVSTRVGGHTGGGDCDAPEEKKATPQFEVSDERSVDEIVAMLRSRGYQPVFADWLPHGFAQGLEPGTEAAFPKRAAAVNEAEAPR